MLQSNIKHARFNIQYSKSLLNPFLFLLEQPGLGLPGFSVIISKNLLKLAGNPPPNKNPRLLLPSFLYSCVLLVSIDIYFSFLVSSLKNT